MGERTSRITQNIFYRRLENFVVLRPKFFKNIMCNVLVLVPTAGRIADSHRNFAAGKINVSQRIRKSSLQGLVRAQNYDGLLLCL